MPTDPDDTSAQTHDADEADARAAHQADRPPTALWGADAEKNELDPEVAESYKESMERGADVKGEGQI